MYRSIILLVYNNYYSLAFQPPPSAYNTSVNQIITVVICPKIDTTSADTITDQANLLIPISTATKASSDVYIIVARNARQLRNIVVTLPTKYCCNT